MEFNKIGLSLVISSSTFGRYAIAQIAHNEEQESMIYMVCIDKSESQRIIDLCKQRAEYEGSISIYTKASFYDYYLNQAYDRLARGDSVHDVKAFLYGFD